nr:MAG TPA: hypothetical protein [Caudoviricetes sp.]
MFRIYRLRSGVRGTCRIRFFRILIEFVLKFFVIMRLVW